MPPHRRVRLAGLLILVTGWIAAAVVLVSSSRAVDEGLQVDSRGETFTLERIGGKAVVRTVAFDRWFASLWHGERLAWTLALLSLAVAGSCFYVAGLMGEDVADDGVPPPGRRE